MDKIQKLLKQLETNEARIEIQKYYTGKVNIIRQQIWDNNDKALSELKYSDNDIARIQAKIYEEFI